MFLPYFSGSGVFSAMFTLFGINGPFNKSLVSCLIKNVLVNCVNVKVEVNCGVSVGLGFAKIR